MFKNREVREHPVLAALYHIRWCGDGVMLDA